MPKEIAHFTMARMMRDQMIRARMEDDQTIEDQSGKDLAGEAYGPFREAVRRYPSLFILGAVVPDINFYCMAGSGAKEIQALSAPFHRCDRRALLPVFEFIDRRLARRKAVSQGDLPALALAAGVVCHILADTIFHPLVYFYAGMDGVHPDATVRHRQFETAMDLYFWQTDPKERGHWIGRRISAAEISNQALVSLLGDLYQAGPLGGPPAVRRAIRWHKGIQYLFFARWMKQIMAGCRKMGRPLSGKATGLTYPFSRGVALPFFSGKIIFQDPCTGVKKESRTMEMAREAVDEALRVLALAAQSIRKEGALVPFLMDHPGLPVIRPGLPQEQATIWNEEENIMPRIYQGYSPPF